MADDFHADTIIEFVKNAGTTNARVSWDTKDAAPGMYTIRVDGSSRDVSGGLTPFTGSATVTVA